MCDPSILVFNPRLSAFMVAVMYISAFIIGMLISYHELTNQYSVTAHCFEIKFKIEKYPLSEQNKERFRLKFARANYYLLVIAYRIIIVMGLIIPQSILFIAYFDSNFNFNLILMSFFAIAQFISIYHLVGLFWFSAAFLYISLEYLRIKFDEIHKRFELSLKSYRYKMSMAILKDAIFEHVYIEKMTSDFNRYLGKSIFVIYYTLTPGILGAIYNTHHDETKMSIKVVILIFVFFLLSGIFLMAKMAIMVNHEAKRSRTLIYSYLSRTELKFETKNKLFLITFMEHLTEREIGFFCWNLFPINSFEIYRYIYFSAQNYLLIMDLF